MFVNSDYSDLLKIFNDNGVKYLVIGGYAVIQHAEPRFTKDLDLWISTDAVNAATVYKSLQEFGAPLVGLTEADFAEEGYFYQMGVPPVRIDILMGIPGLQFAEAWKRRIEVKFDRPRPIGEMTMPSHRVFAMKFANVYPLYVQKAERKNRTKEEVDQIICWLTGYNQAGLQQQIEQGNDFETFFAQAPAINPNSSLIKGIVCGVRVEEIEEPLMQKIRYLDKLIDELAKGKTMEKILRQ